MKIGYKKAIETLYVEYVRLKANQGDPEAVQSIREGIEYLCEPFREDLSENIRSPLQDPQFTLDQRDRSTPEKEAAFWEHMAVHSERDMELTRYSLEILRKL